MKTGYKTYNGWTNYATWRVNLEVFDGYPWDYPCEITSEMCNEIADYIVLGDAEECLATYCARAFLANVNWQEIADAYDKKKV